tara:strand:+ start:497 stop:913 length:417 start_codon:yes stop_codon:yes gene_type:complete
MERDMKNRYNELSEKTKNKIDLFINSLASGTNEQEAYNEAFKTLKYTFKIVSTIKTKDFSDTIKVGDSLYQMYDDELELFDTKDEAYDAGQEILVGLDGGNAYNLALESAQIHIRQVSVNSTALNLNDTDQLAIETLL